jgi:NAD(P)-dependent dehydrogenase (short-subunit alcohol dehydrogenase family)
MSGNLFNVEEKVVVITGGMGQLGQQFAYTLANRGAKVAIFDIVKAANITRSGNEIQVIDQNISFHDVDITDRASIESGLHEVIAQWGLPYGLINNAAIDTPPGGPIEDSGPFETFPDQSWEKVMQVNVKGTFHCCQLIGGAMAEQGRGSIINISSIYGLVSPDQRLYEYRRREGHPFFKPAAYSVSKSAILNLTRYLATYWSDQGVRVNTLTLGGVFNNQHHEFLKQYCARVPLGRMAREDEYNGAVIFLLSEASSYMTGSNLIIDGGWTAW